MFDRRLISMQNRMLEPSARWLARRNIGADGITLAGFAIGLAALPLLASSAFLAALVAILLNRLCDGLDGAVARIRGPTDRGAFLDIALDFFFYASVPLGFALADPVANGLPAAVLLLSFVGTGSSFLAFAAISHKRAQVIAPYPGKGLQFVGGLTEGAETIAAFAAMCVFPRWFPVIAYGFAAACFVTAAMRWWWGWKHFGTTG